LGPINADERTLLEEILGALEAHLGRGKVKAIIGTLTLDRGYWGAGFLWKLTHVWGVDFVTLVRDHGLGVAQAVEDYCAALNPAFVSRSMRVSRRGRATRKKVWVCGINALPLRRYGPEARFKTQGEVNVVVLQDEDEEGRPRRRIYVTSLDAEQDLFRIVTLYHDRWTTRESRHSPPVTTMAPAGSGRPQSHLDPGPDLLGPYALQRGEDLSR